jgi:hypothetical protein
MADKSGAGARGLAAAITAASSDPELYKKIEDGDKRGLAESLARFDLTAEETVAFLRHDIATFRRLGLNRSIIERAGWCTGD